MGLSPRQLIICIHVLFAVFLVSCQGKNSLTGKFNFSNSEKTDSIEVQRLMAQSQKSLLTDYALGIKLAIQATEKAERTTYTQLTYDSYKLAATGALSAGTFDVAEIYLNKFLHLAEVEQDDKMIGKAYANLAMLHLYLNENSKADSLFNKGLQLMNNYSLSTREAIPYKDQIVIYLNLGHIYRKQNKLVAAENMYLKALKLAASSKEYIIYEGQLSQGLGILYLEMNRMPKAKFYLDYSMNLHRNQQITSMIAEVLLGYGRYFERTNQAEEAIKSYEEGIALADQVKSIDLKVEFSDYLYKIFKAQKNFEKAFYYLNLNLEQKELSKKQVTREELQRKSIQRKLMKEESAIQEQQQKNNTFIAIFIIMLISIAAFYIRNTMIARKEINLLVQENQEKGNLKE